MERTQEEIDAVLNQCSAAEESGDSIAPGMSYEQGLKSAIEWMLGWTDTHPLED